MAKKKESTKNPKNPSKIKPHSAKSFPQFALLPMIGMLGLSILFGIAYDLFFSNTMNQGKQQQRADLQAQLFAQQVDQTMNLLDQSLHGVVSMQALTSALTTANANDDLNSLEQDLNALIPYSLKLRIIANGSAKVDKKNFPPLTFSAVDMIQNAEIGETIHPEVFTTDNQRILNWVKTIKRDEEVIGSLFASINFNALLGKATSSTHADTSVQLIQQFKNGTPLTLFSQGSKQTQSSAIRSEKKTGNPNWTVIYTVTPISMTNRLIASIPPLLIVFIFGITAAFLAFRSLEKHLRVDSALLISHLEEIKFGQYSKTPSFSVLFMETLDHTLERIFSDFKTESTTPFQVSASSAQEEGEREDSETSSPFTQSDAAPDSDANPEPPAGFELPENLDGNSKEFPGHGLPSAEVDDQLEIPDIPTSIFRAYDIRGIVDKDITVETIRLLGQSIGSEAITKGEQRIFVGRDGRLSSPVLCEALVEGLLSTGINVTNIGIVPTPMLWFACHTERGSQSGVMVTGSHNPAHYNGLKIMIAGNTLSGKSVLALRDRLIRNAIEKGAGEENTESIKEDYINHIAEDVILATPMTIVLDCGNGAASEVAPELFNELGCNTIPLFAEIDGNFPNHHPDPSREENLEDLKAAVKENKADIGIAFDGDGDRIGIVTPSGKVIWPDRLMMLYAKDLLVRSPGADIIFDVKCSRRLPELISNLGGRPLMWKTGHSMIKGKLKEMNAALAGEMSGHIFFNDRWFGFDDALYCGARLLEILSTESEDVEHVFASLPESLATPEIFIPVPEDRKFQIIQSLEEVGQFGSGKMNTIDGIRVDYPKAWGLIRASNTTPALTARFEAHNEEALVQIHSLFQKQLKQVDENLVIEDLHLEASPDL